MPHPLAAHEALAMRALDFVVEDEERTRAFLDETGLEGADLEARAHEPEFLGFALDYLLAHEALLVDFMEARKIDYQAIIQARAALPGGDAPFWM